MAVLPDEANLLWFGTVEKVGSNLAAHPRVLFVTPQAILVSLPTGGVTRIIEHSNVTEISVSNASSPVCRVTVRSEQDLVVVLGTVDDAKAFVSAVERARDALRAETTVPPVTIRWDSSNPGTPGFEQPTGLRPSVGGRKVSFADDDYLEPLETRKVVTTKGDSPQALDAASSTPSRQSLGKISLHPLRPSEATPKNVEAMNVPPSAIVSLQQQLDATQRVVEDLRRTQQEDSKLRQELDESRKLVADLQAALRSQDGAFNEMLRAQETLRSHEVAKNALEQRILALEEANAKLKRDVDARDKIIEEQRQNLQAAEASHKSEIKTIRDTFSDYDSQVTAFVQRIRQECDEKIKVLQDQNNELLVEQGKLKSKLELMDASVRQAVQATAGWMPSAINSNADSSFFGATQHKVADPPDSSDLRAALIASLHKYADKKFAHVAPQGHRHKHTTPRHPPSPRRNRPDDVAVQHQYNTPPAQWSSQFRDRSLL